MGLIAVPNGAGKLDLIASVNNGNAVALRKRSAAEPARTLRLRGPQSDLVGARITVKYADGSNQVFEISAGNGYLSQSASDSVVIGSSPVVCSVRLASGRELTHTFLNGQSDRIDIGESSK